MPTPSRHRSAKTGKFVTAKKASKAPNTTVKEKVRRWPAKEVEQILYLVMAWRMSQTEAHKHLKQLLHK